jgi:hypothetical protein
VRGATAAIVDVCGLRCTLNSGQICPHHAVAGSWHKTLRPYDRHCSALGILLATSGSQQRVEDRNMKPTHMLIAVSVLGLGWPNAAIAATLCVGKDYAGISAEQRNQLETELRKKGGLKRGDQLAPCDAQTISATRSPSASPQKADRKQANSCKKDCDTVGGVAEVVCLIPALAAACVIVKPALKSVCPAACEAKHARSAPQSLSRRNSLMTRPPMIPIVWRSPVAPS